MFLLRRPDVTDSIAVLPFANTSADPETDYISDGITEGIISKLSAVPDLKVISRTSAFHYKGKKIDLNEISDRLGVRAVLVGRVLQRGDGFHR